VFRSGSRRIRDGAPLYFDALRRRRHGACASRMTQTPPPATIRNPKPKPKPKPKPTHCWAGAVARKKRACPRYRRSSITGDAPVPSWPPKPQTNRRCELMLPLPIPIPEARSLCLPAAFSQSPAESPIKTASAPRLCKAVRRARCSAERGARCAMRDARCAVRGARCTAVQRVQRLATCAVRRGGGQSGRVLACRATNDEV